MFSDNWRSDIAVARGLVVVLLTVGWISEAVALGRPSGGVQGELKEQQRDAHEYCAKNPLFCLKDQPPREAYEPRCKEQNYTDCLLAWRNTRAAEAQARAAYVQVSYTERQTWLLVFTFIATAWAAVFAGQAAKATARTAAIAAHASRVELRAYLSVTPGGINELIGNRRAMGHVDIQNVGKLPAREVVVQVRMRILDREDAPTERMRDFPVIPDPYDPNRVDNIDRAILPGTKMRQGAAEGDTVPVSDLLNALDQYVYVWGVVYYNDGYQRRHTHFRQRYAVASHVRRDDWHEPTYVTREIIAVDQARVHPYGNRAN